jgi:hypothetical protein
MVIAMTYAFQGQVETLGDNLCLIRYFQIVEMMPLLSLTITVAVLVSYTQTTFLEPAGHRLPPIQAFARSARAGAMLLEGSYL